MAEAETKKCDKHDVEMKFIPAGVSKRTGNPYNAFWACDICGEEKRAARSGANEGILQEINNKLDKVLEYIASRS